MNNNDILRIAIILSILVIGFTTPKRASKRYDSHNNQYAIDSEINNIYANLYKSKYEEFSWDTANTVSGNFTCTYFEIAKNGIITGVDIPNSPVASTDFGIGDLCTTSKATYYRTNAGSQRVNVYFFNNSGGDINPDTTKWRVWYMPIER